MVSDRWLAGQCSRPFNAKDDSDRQRLVEAATP
jgi:hypothetical protein